MAPAPPLLVPVHLGRQTLAFRFFRTLTGQRTAVAFTSRDRLTKVLGDEQAWTRLSERALRGMIEDLGVIGIVIDPVGATGVRNQRPWVA